MSEHDDQKARPRLCWILVLTNAGAAMVAVAIVFWCMVGFQSLIDRAGFWIIWMPGALALGALGGLVSQFIRPFFHRLRYGLRAVLPGTLATAIGGLVILLVNTLPEMLERPHVEAIAYSPDGGRIATMAGFDLFEWEVHLGKRLGSFENVVSYGCNVVQYSPDGRQILVAQPGSVKSCEMGAMECSTVSHAPHSTKYGIRFAWCAAPSDRYVAVRVEEKPNRTGYLLSLVDLGSMQSLVSLEVNPKLLPLGPPLALMAPELPPGSDGRKMARSGFMIPERASGSSHFPPRASALSFSVLTAAVSLPAASTTW